MKVTTEITRRSLSCPSIHYALFMAPNELRHCCKRYYINGERKGDAVVFKVDSDDDINIDMIIQAKKDLYDAINNGEKTQCSGCPYLTLDEWPSLDQLEIKHLSIESQTRCNMRCSYCDETYYGGELPNYSLIESLYKFESKGVISKNLTMAWGGGEPLLLDEFENIFSLYTNKLN